MKEDVGEISHILNGWIPQRRMVLLNTIISPIFWGMIFFFKLNINFNEDSLNSKIRSLFFFWTKKRFHYKKFDIFFFFLTWNIERCTSFCLRDCISRQSWWLVLCSFFWRPRHKCHINRCFQLVAVLVLVPLFCVSFLWWNFFFFCNIDKWMRRNGGEMVEKCNNECHCHHHHEIPVSAIKKNYTNQECQIRHFLFPFIKLHKFVYFF